MVCADALCVSVCLQSSYFPCTKMVTGIPVMNPTSFLLDVNLTATCQSRMNPGGLSALPQRQQVCTCHKHITRTTARTLCCSQTGTCCRHLPHSGRGGVHTQTLTKRSESGEGDEVTVGCSKYSKMGVAVLYKRTSLASSTSGTYHSNPFKCERGLVQWCLVCVPMGGRVASS